MKEKDGDNIINTNPHTNIKEMRKILINQAGQKEFVDNTIKTAKYNWFTFFPLAVLYQFNNYFNIRFLSNWNARKRWA